MTTAVELGMAIRTIVQEEIERGMPVEFWMRNEFGADVVVPSERKAREIAQAVANRLYPRLTITVDLGLGEG